ncbi:MAG: proteasome subunit beta [Acidimicrobiia bacterium]|nr:proteasome subunit beta [Acidimicrobiia bacterium]
MRGPLPMEGGTRGFTELLHEMGITPGTELVPGEKVPTVPEGTTVLAMRFDSGVVIAGDRRATAGSLVAHRNIRKVFATDEWSAMAVAGTAGLALEMVRLFQTELEHFEKIEGRALTLDGKANYLSRMVRNQLPMAMQGLVVVPLFAGYDHLDDIGRLYTFDVVGGRYEEQEYGTTGSGASLAKAYLRASYTAIPPENEAVSLAVRALVSAAQEDTATGGPDLRREIFPNVLKIDADGTTEIEDTVLQPIASEALETIR